MGESAIAVRKAGRPVSILGSELLAMSLSRPTRDFLHRLVRGLSGRQQRLDVECYALLLVAESTLQVRINAASTHTSRLQNGEDTARGEISRVA
jgi:hypothetical protein